MKVVLKEDLEKFGVVGDVVEVAAGYARNYLVPKGLAVKATQANMKLVTQQQAQDEARSQTGDMRPRNQFGDRWDRWDHGSLELLAIDVQGAVCRPAPYRPPSRGRRTIGAPCG